MANEHSGCESWRRGRIELVTATSSSVSVQWYGGMRMYQAYMGPVHPFVCVGESGPVYESMRSPSLPATRPVARLRGRAILSVPVLRCRQTAMGSG